MTAYIRQVLVKTTTTTTRLHTFSVDHVCSEPCVTLRNGLTRHHHSSSRGHRLLIVFRNRAGDPQNGQAGQRPGDRPKQHGPLSLSGQRLHGGEVPPHVHPLWVRLSGLHTRHRPRQSLQTAAAGQRPGYPQGETPFNSLQFILYGPISTRTHTTSLTFDLASDQEKLPKKNFHMETI